MTGLDRTVAALERGRQDGYHPGAQLEVRLDGEEVASVAIGDAMPGVPMRPDTLLPWFSCTKAVTAVAVLQQWERGALALDDPVARHVPEFARNGKHAVTVRHVLTHTAGFRRLPPGVAPEALWRADWDEAVALVCACELEAGWVPGRRAGYHAATSFLLLGEIVRRLDGRPYDAYVTEEIFEPLDMPDSWVALGPARFAAYRAEGRMGAMHDTSTAEGKVTPTPRPGYDDGRALARPMPSGSGVGPMRDLVRLYEAFLGGGALGGHRVLGAPAVEAMLARHRAGMKDETFGMVIDWGLGLLVNSFHYRTRPTSYGFGKHASPRAAGHGGSQSSLAFCDPEFGLAVALCCNGMPGEAGNHRRTQPVLTALYEDLGLAGGSKPGRP